MTGPRIQQYVVLLDNVIRIHRRYIKRHTGKSLKYDIRSAIVYVPISFDSQIFIVTDLHITCILADVRNKVAEE